MCVKVGDEIVCGEAQDVAGKDALIIPSLDEKDQISTPVDVIVPGEDGTLADEEAPETRDVSGSPDERVIEPEAPSQIPPDQINDQDQNLPGEEPTEQIPGKQTVIETKVIEKGPEQGELITVKRISGLGLPEFSVKEGQKLSLKSIKFIDEDGDPLTVTWPYPFNSQGEWQTELGDAGKKIVSVKVSDGQSTKAQRLSIIIEAVNKAPVIDIPEVIEAQEGTALTLEPKITDPDGDPITVAYSGFMDKSTYVPTYDDAGSHEVVIAATDGYLTARKTVTIQVLNKNRKPSINEVSIPRVTAGEKQTTIDDAGSHLVTVTVSDGESQVKKSASFTVLRKNKPPVMEPIPNIHINIDKDETQEIKITPIVRDPDGDEVRILYTGWMNNSSKVIIYNDGGVYKATVSATDGQDAVSQTVTITVNRVPQIIYD
ncbi:hypothetical protein J4460_08975 [Candidatus Woesearchaeota archaeon]|nr:hypothetical protein [Candidatus Woesearchaeota archaeon]